MSKARFISSAHKTVSPWIFESETSLTQGYRRIILGDPLRFTFKEVKEGSDKEDEVGLSSGYMDNQERMKIQKEYEESVLKWKVI